LFPRHEITVIGRSLVKSMPCKYCDANAYRLLSNLPRIRRDLNAPHGPRSSPRAALLRPDLLDELAGDVLADVADDERVGRGDLGAEVLGHGVA